MQTSRYNIYICKHDPLNVNGAGDTKLDEL